MPILIFLLLLCMMQSAPDCDQHCRTNSFLPAAPISRPFEAILAAATPPRKRFSSGSASSLSPSTKRQCVAPGLPQPLPQSDVEEDEDEATWEQKDNDETDDLETRLSALITSLPQWYLQVFPIFCSSSSCLFVCSTPEAFK